MKIAIQGHPTRGKEIIQILESLGGENRRGLTGTYKSFYCINDKNQIIDVHKKNLPLTYTFFTLEEFEKEFPFKVGDRVVALTTGLIGTITKFSENGMYHFKYDNGICSLALAKYLKLYKEMKEKRNITLTLDKAKEWYKKGGELKEIALQAYLEEELTKIEPPKSWEEFCDNCMINENEAYFDSCCTVHSADMTCRNSSYDKNICPSKKSAEAHLALIQLEQLRDCWRQGWEPDYDDVSQAKYHISYHRGKLEVTPIFNVRYFLTFPTNKMAKEFLKCFRDLIEIAGDLI